MSFLASPRGYDSLARSDLALPAIHPSNSRLPMQPLSAFDSVPVHLPPLAPAAPATAPDAPQPADRSTTALPKLGQTRCYWSLLTPDLHFLYLDPVLAHHLQDQAELLVNKSLLDFVHPDEQASAKLDLGSVLESRTLHGSVTRVRYSRLSRVRKVLGYQGPAQEWPDADKVAVDDNYMAIDIVINWASDGLVLCFMHAVVDLSPHDNDEHHKTPWTNWCGTPFMSMDQVQLLHSRLLSAVPQPLSMSRVFQILLNQPERSLCMSWPPDQPEPGGPISKDFAKLAQDVQISSGSASGTDAKTSCTRRYKAHQTMNFGVENAKEVESIFIPHGSIIFACHKVHPSTRELNPNEAATHSSHYYPPPGNHPYPDQAHSYSLPPVPAPSQYHNSFPPPPHHSAHYSSGSNWPPHPESPGSPPHYQQWNTAPSVSSVRSSTYSAPPQQHQWPSQPPSYLDASSAPPPPLNSGPQGSPYPPPNSGNDDPPPSPGSDTVPPSRVIHRRGSNTRDQYGNGGRSTGNPPVGVARCASCKATHSPEWRKGPSGKKDLCNACGLRYARSRAKKEGGPPQQSRRRKDRVFDSLSKEPSPSGSPVPAPYSNVRRGSYYEDGSFPSTSNGSPGELYPPPPRSGHPGFTGTPSPSPPNGGMHYPYPHPPPHHQNADGRSHYGAHGGQFYSVPPPAPPQQGLPHLAGHEHPPRLEPVTPYSGPNQSSPGVSPTSPIGGSPMSGNLSIASFERDRTHREHEREGLQPTPVSAETRRSGRSGYMRD